MIQKEGRRSLNTVYSDRLSYSEGRKSEVCPREATAHQDAARTRRRLGGLFPQKAEKKKNNLGKKTLLLRVGTGVVKGKVI